jgi:hypothetical protein
VQFFPLKADPGQIPFLTERQKQLTFSNGPALMQVSVPSPAAMNKTVLKGHPEIQCSDSDTGIT